MKIEPAEMAGDIDDFADPVAVFNNEDAPPALARLDGAHQAGGATADDDYVVWNDYLTGRTRTVRGRLRLAEPKVDRESELAVIAIIASGLETGLLY